MPNCIVDLPAICAGRLAWPVVDIKRLLGGGQ
jgi:hypothetical protein